MSEWNYQCIFFHHGFKSHDSSLCTLHKYRHGIYFKLTTLFTKCIHVFTSRNTNFVIKVLIILNAETTTGYMKMKPPSWAYKLAYSLHTVARKCSSTAGGAVSLYITAGSSRISKSKSFLEWILGTPDLQWAITGIASIRSLCRTSQSNSMTVSSWNYKHFRETCTLCNATRQTNNNKKK